MEEVPRNRAQSVLSFRQSGFQFRASKLFSKFKIHSAKPKVDNGSPYMQLPNATQPHPKDRSSRNRDSLKPYMSQPVLGLALDHADDDDEGLHSPTSASNSGNSSADVSSQLSPAVASERPRRSFDPPESPSKLVPDSPANLKRHSHSPSPLGTAFVAATRAGTAVAGLPSGNKGQSNSQSAKVDGLPNVLSFEVTGDFQVPHPSTTSQVAGSEGPKELQTLPEGARLEPTTSTSTARPRIPSRPPPPVPPDEHIRSDMSSSGLAPPDIIVSPHQSQEVNLSSSRLSKTASVYSDMSGFTASEGYETAPSTPGSSMFLSSDRADSSPRADSTHSDLPADDVTLTFPPNSPAVPEASPSSAITEAKPVIYDEPEGLLDAAPASGPSNPEVNSSPARPSQIPLPSPNVLSPTTIINTSPKRSPAPRLTTPLPSPLPPIRTSTLPDASPARENLSPSPLRTPGAQEQLHRRFSTAPGQRGSVVFTPTGEAARFSPSIITYHRLPPGAMRQPLPFPSTGVDEEGRKVDSPRSPTISQTTRGVSGLMRGVSESTVAFWKTSSTSDRPESSKKATLREMPAMSVGGEMDHGDDGDHDSSDESDSSDEDNDTPANAGDDDDDDTTESTGPVRAGMLPGPLGDKRLWSFSSVRGKAPGKPSRQFSQESSKSAASASTVKPHEPVLDGLPDVDTSPMDFSFLTDPKGKGKARESTGQITPTSHQQHPSIKVSTASGMDYFNSKTPTASPSTSAVWDAWGKLTPKTPGGVNPASRTPSGGYASPEAVPAVPPIPKTIMMPPVPVRGDGERPTIYKQASRSMIDILSMSRDNDEPAPVPTSPIPESIETGSQQEASSTDAKQTRQKKISNAPPYEALGQGSGLRRQRSMPTFNPASDPPPYPAFPPGPKGMSRANIIILPHEDEGKEILPPYTNDIYLKAIMPMKMEFTAPGVQAKDRKWKRVLCVLEGTSFKLYRCRPGKNIPGGVSAFGSWWERKVGAADVSTGVANAASNARIEREKEKERQRQLEAVRKLEGEAQKTAAGVISLNDPGQTDIILPRPSPPSQSASGSKFGLSKLKPHNRSRSEVPKPSTLGRPPSSPRASINSLRPAGRSSNSGEGSPLIRESLDVPSSQGSSAAPSRASLSLSLQRTTSAASGTAFSISASTSSHAVSSTAESSTRPASIRSSASQSFNNGVGDAIPDPVPSDLIKAYTLQHAESGLGNDYVKRRNVIRMRMEGEQFLLQATDVSEVVEWIEGLHAAANVALDLDERPMPKGPLFPRRRRRRRARPGQPGAENGATVVEEQSGTTTNALNAS